MSNPPSKRDANGQDPVVSPRSEEDQRDRIETLSDTNRTLSDQDQTLSDRDQEASDEDQAACLHETLLSVDDDYARPGAWIDASLLES